MGQKLFFSFFLILWAFNLGFSQIDSTNVPLVIIDTHDRQIEDEPKIPADMKIIYHEDQYSHLTDSGNIYQGRIGIEIRGSYSAGLPQKPYGIETRDSTGENLNIPLFHMPPENDWILLANFNDKTFLRNALSFELFRRMGHYAPRTQFCEVVVNNEYQGIYILTEKIKQDNDRVDIADLNPDENAGDDVTGGYIIKVDYYDETNSWKSKFSPLGQPGVDVFLVYHYPKPDEITGAQKTYIQNFINDFETLLYTSPESALMNNLSRYVDIGSFIDYIILNELARNVDILKKSSFFHKDKDSKDGRLHAGPVWDFDWSYKNINECYFGAQDGSGWAHRSHECDNWPIPPSWIPRLMRNGAFARQLVDRYHNLRQSTLSEATIFQYIDSSAMVLESAQERHFRKWQILGINVGTPETDSQPLTFEGEIEKFKDWISTRLTWLDANFPRFVVTDIEDQDWRESVVRIFPNPVNSQLSVQSQQTITSIVITTMTGTIIKHNQSYATSSVSIDVSDIPSGIYLLNVFNQNGNRTTKKMIVGK